MHSYQYEKDGKITVLCQHCFNDKVAQDEASSAKKMKDQIDYLSDTVKRLVETTNTKKMKDQIDYLSDIVKRLVETTNNLRSDINYLKSE